MLNIPRHLSSQGAKGLILVRIDTDTGQIWVKFPEPLSINKTVSATKSLFLQADGTLGPSPDTPEGQ